MKNSLLFIIITSLSQIVMGQVHEIGVSFGGSNYVGDIGNNYFIYPNKPAGALFYKFNWNPRVALRGTYSFLPIEGDDAKADTNFRNIRNINFSNTIHELAVGIEYNFYEYDVSSSDKSWTPYILLELAGYNYTNVTSHSSTGSPIFGNKSSIALPLGIGFKSKLYRKLAFAIETKFRYTFVDDLDFVNNSTPNVNVEGTGNDWYMFTGFSLIYTFGRPACYKDGF